MLRRIILFGLYDDVGEQFRVILRLLVNLGFYIFFLLILTSMENTVICMDFSIARCNTKNNLFWGSVMNTMFSKSCYIFWYILLGQILLLMPGEFSLHGPLVSLPPASETLICFTFLCCCFFPCHLVQGRSLLTLFSGSCCHGEENSTIPQLI